MTYSETWESFTKLSAADQHRFVEAAQQLAKFSNQHLNIGAKVQFKTKHGVFIAGMVTRRKQKNMEVLSLFNRDGLKPGMPVRWTVAPELLVPIPPDKIGLYEFP